MGVSGVGIDIPSSFSLKFQNVYKALAAFRLIQEFPVFNLCTLLPSNPPPPPPPLKGSELGTEIRGGAKIKARERIGYRK